MKKERKKDNCFSKKGFLFFAVFATIFLSPIHQAQASGENWYNYSWKYRKAITIDHTKVSNSNQSNFTVLVNLTTDSNLANHTKSNGGDILFTSSDGVTKLSHEIEKFDHSTGQLVAWVKIPTLSYTANTVLYMYYGNSDASNQWATDGSAWDSSYKGIWHLNNDPSGSAPQLKDSTSNANDGTFSGSMTSGDQVPGKIDGSTDFDGSNDYAETSTVNSLGVGTTLTLSTWVNFRSSDSNWNAIASRIKKTANNDGYWLGLINNKFRAFVGPCCTNYIDTTLSYSTEAWHYVVLKSDGTNYAIYVDGQKASSDKSVGSIPVSNESARFAYSISSGQVFNGVMDELRISSVNRSVDWMTTEYNNQNSPSTFYSLGSESTSPSSPGSLAQYKSDGIMVISNQGNTNENNIKLSASATDDNNPGVITLFFETALDAGSFNSPNVPTIGTSCTSGTEWNSCDSKIWYVSSESGNHSTTAYTGAITVAGLSEEGYKWQVKACDDNGACSGWATFNATTPNFSVDLVKPNVNASSVFLTGIPNSSWTNTLPTINWTAGADNEGGSGLAGYCISLDESSVTGSETSNTLDPETTAGKLTGLDDGITNASTCGFIATGTSLNLSTVSGLTLTTNKHYYISIKAVDLAGNVYTGSSENYQDLISFRYDNTPPTNVSYISTPGGSFSNVADMYFSWPIEGGTAASDDYSQILGYQYQINSTSGDWKGTTNSSLCSFDYIPATDENYPLTEEENGSSITAGNNVVYFRAVDNACNASISATYRTGNLAYGGAAPTFGGGDSVAITPSTSNTNSYALSWPAATAADGHNISRYYYMINTSPPSTLATLQSNASTYIDNGNSTAVSTSSLPNVNKGNNTVYVVAVDDDSPSNYSPSNVISGTFTLDSTDPDNVGNLVASDSSIKSQSQWNVTLTWTAPAYQGAGNLTYIIKRSTDGTSFSEVGTSTGLSYVDNAPSSTRYYYKVYTKDGADASSSGTNAVSITPTGKWTTPPELEDDPVVSNITTKKATITWNTSRSADSKVAYGTSKGDYNNDEVSNSDQSTSHEINLDNLKAGTTYYFEAKWTDEDGNVGTADEVSFETAPAPTVKNVSAKNIGLTSATIQYTTKDASSVKIYYGTTTSFGGATAVSTSISETTYSTELTGLSDGTKYYYKINTYDADKGEYEGTVLDFTTLPRPKISNVRVQQVANTAQSTLLVSWDSNTEISSIISYYPENNSGQVKNEVNVDLISGQHQMIIRGLQPQTNYTLVVKGLDKVGNQAESDPQRMTTATDTRAPEVGIFTVVGAVIPPAANAGQASSAQFTVTWDTDEPATSQVEFGEGTGEVYSQKTQEDENLTLNHIVIISNLSPSKVYHLRAVSFDSAKNIGNSIDTVAITPKAIDNALDLVVSNLSAAFGFLKDIQ